MDATNPNRARSIWKGPPCPNLAGRSGAQRQAPRSHGI